LLSRLARVRSWGGNYLINCGPMADGRMPGTYYQRLRELGAWMCHSGESLLGTQAGPYPEVGTVPITVHGTTWYLHVGLGHQGPIRVRGAAQPPRAVRLQRTGEPVRWRFQRGVLTVEPSIYVWTGLDDVLAIEWGV
jgi:alpha-L-fucosidase